MYENLTKNLNPEEKQVIQAAVNQADAIAQQQAAESQAQQTNGHSSEPAR
jgi:importin-7